MKDFIKKNIKDILLVALYVFVAQATYFTLVHTLWKNPWIDTAVSLVILIGGCTIGYFYVRGIHKANEKKALEEANKEEIKEESTLEETQEIKEEPTSTLEVESKENNE